MPALPMTHHEIVALVEPFARSGRHVDFRASQRLERRLVFKPVEHAGGCAGEAAVQETLQLDNLESDRYRLTRLLTQPGGLQARLQVEGPAPPDLLARIEAVPVQRQFSTGPGFSSALSHRLEAAGDGLILTDSVVQLDGFRLTLTVSAVKGISAEAALCASAGDAIDLPQDLLAVLGWHWSRLTQRREGWTASLRLRGSGAARSRDAEHKLQAAAAHLARTLAEGPARFHPRWRAARWRLVLRRGFPLLACILMCIAAAFVPQIEMENNSVFRMLVFQAPPLLLVLFFGLGEMPRIEIPPLPRGLTAPAWRQSAGAVTEAVPESVHESVEESIHDPVLGPVQTPVA